MGYSGYFFNSKGQKNMKKGTNCQYFPLFPIVIISEPHEIKTYYLNFLKFAVKAIRS
jgi:hypothetical protein